MDQQEMQPVLRILVDPSLLAKKKVQHLSCVEINFWQETSTSTARPKLLKVEKTNYPNQVYLDAQELWTQMTHISVK